MTAVSIVVEGTIRPLLKMKNIAVTTSASHKGTGGRLVITSIGIITSEPKIVNILSRPCLSAILPTHGEKNMVHSPPRSEEHTSELQSRENLVCRLLLEKKK